VSQGAPSASPRHLIRKAAIALALVAGLLPVVALASPALAVGENFFISEFHYDNSGADAGEFVEVTGDAGDDLAGWSIVLYNGNGGASYNTINLASYNTINLSGVIADQGGGQGTASFDTVGLQNGSPDGLALVDDGGTAVEFLSYEGSFIAVGGPANGMTSTDVGVAEGSSTAIGESLQLVGGVWTGPAANTRGQLNDAPPPAPTVFISEVHYDNSGADAGEFVEVTGDAGDDLAGWSIVLYNGNGGASYNTINLIQNGSPDGLALVDGGGTVIEFLSYEGSFIAVGGPANGMTSVDIGVSEPGSTPIGQSLQLIGGTWTGPAPESPGDLNSAGPVLPTFIHDVQGSGGTSPLVGQVVTIEGIVVGDFQEIVTNDPGDEPLDGFFVQEEDADADSDPATSEGIFVYAPGAPAVSVGDLVRVTGPVSEFFGLTEIAFPSSVSVEGSFFSLPSPAMPVMPTAVGDAEVDWEAIEGMSVLFNDPLYVTGMFSQGAYGELQLSAIGPQDHPNQTNPVGSTAAFDQRALNQASRVILDDGEDENEFFPSGLSTWNPDPTPYLSPLDGTRRSGDAVIDLFGVVHYAFGEYEVQPVNLLDPTDPDGAVDIERTEPRPGVPAVGGGLQVASFNVLNYFTTIDNGDPICGPPGFEQRCRGADTAQEFADQAAKIVDALVDLDADIVGLIEIENNAGVAVADLVDRLNTDPDATRTYGSIDTGYIGTDAIAVALIYDTATVAPAGGFAVLDGGVSAAYIDDRNRPALAQTFEQLATRGTLTVAVNHLKSKGSPCLDVDNPGDPAFGVAAYPPGTDGDDPNLQGNCNLTRTAAAQVLGQWLASEPTGTGSDNLLILGDLNAYANEDPITVLEGQGYTDVNELFSGGNSWAHGAHSYVFDGELGTLDYGMANAALLAEVTGAAAWHINADEPFAIDYQNFNPPGQYTPDEFKSSDHDPILVGMDLPTPADLTCNGLAATIVGSGVIYGTNQNDVIVSLGADDVIHAGNGNDTVCAGAGNDLVYGGNGDDTILGEQGSDWLDAGNGNDEVVGGSGNDTLVGANGDDTLSGDAGDDDLFGGRGDDALDGGDDDDLADGGMGADSCLNAETEISCEA
jgi:predicted extracellular nuclease